LSMALRGLAGRQDIEIRRRRAKVDIDDLVAKLRRQIPELSAPSLAAEQVAAAPRSVINADKINTQISGDVRTEIFHAGPSIR